MQFYIRSDSGKIRCMQKKKASLRMPMPPKYLVERANLKWKILVAGVDMRAATSGSLAPSGISHPLWKMSTDTRGPVSKRKRTTLIFSCMTIFKDEYDF